jgi:hypothetical protein
VECPLCRHRFNVAKTRKSRSIEQHRRFFALCAAAFHHWPETHDEQFSTVHELRAWLTMKAGFRDEVARIPLADMDVDKARSLAAAAIKAAGSHAAVRAHNGLIVVFKPRSIQFDKMKHLDFCALNEAVADVINAELHLTADELLQQHEMAK